MRVSTTQARLVLNGTFEQQYAWMDAMLLPIKRRFLAAYADGFVLLDEHYKPVRAITPKSLDRVNFIEHTLVIIQHPHYVLTQKYLDDTLDLNPSVNETVARSRDEMVENLRSYLRTMEQTGNRYMEMPMTYERYQVFYETYREHWVKQGTKRFHQEFTFAKKI